MWCSLRVSDHSLGKGYLQLGDPQFLSEVTVTQVQALAQSCISHPLQDIFSMCAGSADVVSQRSKGVPAQNLSFCCHGHLNVSGVLMMGG